MEDERNQIDKLFSDGLGDFNPSPPPELWERIGSGLPAPVSVAPVASVNGYSRLIFLGIAAAFFTGLAVLWFVADDNGTGPEKNNALLQTEKTNDGLSIEKPGHESTAVKPSGANNATRNTQKNNSESTPDQTKKERTSPIIEITNAVSPSSLAETATQQTPNVLFQNPGSGVQPEISQNKDVIDDLRSDFTTWLNSQPAGLLRVTAATVFQNQYRTSHKPALPKGNGIPLIGGLYASLDQIDYGKGHKKQSYAAGLSLSTFKGPWIIETGLAYCLSGDNGRYMINYNSWDSLGYYNRVVSFSPDPDNPGTIKFNTKVEGVYDSIDHALETKTINKYAYLQIPLMAGYRIYSNRLLTISLKAGPVFSLLMGSNEPAATFSQDGASLQSIDNLSTTRVSTNWQIAAGLGIGLHLSPRFSLLAEPVYKTYLRPVYRNHSTKPQSIGIKAGLLYRF